MDFSFRIGIVLVSDFDFVLGGFGGMDIYRVFTPEELPETAFNGCIDASLGSFEVIFDASESIDPDGAEIEFEWEFGDFKSAKGKRVEHIYTKPGVYNVLMNVIDLETGMIEKEEQELDVEISNVDYWNFECKNILEVNKLAEFDATKLSVRKGEIKDIYWQLFFV